MRVRIWDAIGVAFVCIFLTLGLWPFHAPANTVTWLRDRAGVHLGTPATIIGSNAIASRNETNASIEVRLRPESIWDSGTFLALYCPENRREFSLRQSQTDLDVATKIFGSVDETSMVRVPDVFRRNTAVFITLSSSGNGTAVYTDGKLTRSAAGFQIPRAAFAGRLIIGDMPVHTDTWSGQFLGLAFYGQALTADRVLEHYHSWIKRGRPEVAAEDRVMALYLFAEHSGKTAHSEVGSGSLSIPDQYTVVDKVRLEPAWEEFEISGHYYRAFVKNVVGFIPLGFYFYFYWLVVRQTKRPALFTILVGAAVSFAIEFFQSYLPTRESGMTDLITNTAGTGLGILLYRRLLDVWDQRPIRL